MELKDFQQSVLTRLGNYLDVLSEWHARAEQVRAAFPEDDPKAALAVPDFTAKTWEQLQADGVLPLIRRQTPFGERQDGVGRPVPNVTLKIPTGGGKTLLAAASVELILSKWLRQNNGFVLWIVPNEAIYSQTRKALVDRAHPYRQMLDRASANRVRFLEKDHPLRKEDVESHLCVMLLMLQSANRENKQTLRLFADRGNILGFVPNEADYEAHHELRQNIPNLETYGEAGSIGAIVKESLGNALRILRPIIVLDEGHKAFSRLAHQTVFGFNPSFVLELSATPADRKEDTRTVYSNWLVDIRGTDLEREEMVKLPINVKVRGGHDWKAMVRIAIEQLNSLQTNADQLRQEQDRYVRPICLVQVERTGDDQRDGRHIHSQDVKDYLVSLGIHEDQVAIKTSELDDLSGLDLLSPTCVVRFIVTKFALQEGWDCSFAYVLCALAPIASERSLTQLVGRILRQPDTRRTGIEVLDQCYVLCLHHETETVINSIKRGLEADGMGDLIADIRSDDAKGKESATAALKRRDEFKDLEIFLPVVNWSDGKSLRRLDYDSDIRFRVDWDGISLVPFFDQLRASSQGEAELTARLELSPDPEELIRTVGQQIRVLGSAFDPVFATRSIVDIVGNPWVARSIVQSALEGLLKRRWSEPQLGNHSSRIIDTLRSCVEVIFNERAELLFRQFARSGEVQFRLLKMLHNYRMPQEVPNAFPANSDELRRPKDNAIVAHSLFSPAYRDAFDSGLERNVAGWLDGESSMKWWHRNVARSQYHLQGWRKHRVYPDFIFARRVESGKERFYVLEAKGAHLANKEDTVYKRKLMTLCSEIFRAEELRSLQEVWGIPDIEAVVCAVIEEGSWENGLAKLLS